MILGVRLLDTLIRSKLKTTLRPMALGAGTPLIRLDMKATAMSCAARVHFIPESDPECAPSAEETRDMAHGLGWNMTGQEMENGMALLDALAPPRTAA